MMLSYIDVRFTLGVCSPGGRAGEGQPGPVVAAVLSFEVALPARPRSSAGWCTPSPNEAPIRDAVVLIDGQRIRRVIERDLPAHPLAPRAA